MISRALTILAGFVLIMHGLIHLMGTAVYVNHADIKNLAYKTTLLGGHWDIGDVGMRIFGSLWILPAIGFAVASVALVAGWSWWKPVLVVITLLSLALTTLDWSMAFAGAVADLLILVLVASVPAIVNSFS